MFSGAMQKGCDNLSHSGEAQANKAVKVTAHVKRLLLRGQFFNLWPLNLEVSVVYHCKAEEVQPFKEHVGSNAIVIPLLCYHSEWLRVLLLGLFTCLYLAELA